MKTMIILSLVVFLSAGTAFGAAKLIKGEEIAQVGISTDNIKVFRVIDGDTTCYVTRGGKTVYHAISCVK